jgi:hypothetical protein
MFRSITRVAGAAGALALTFATAPPALAAGSVFGGTTKAGDPIVLTGDRTAKKLKSVVVSAEARCDNGMYFPLGLKLAATPATPGFSAGPRDLVVSRNARARFAGEAHGIRDLGDEYAQVDLKVAGTLRARSAAGTLSLDVAVLTAQSRAPTAACHTGSLSWAATRAPGRVYGGLSDQEEPVVVRLDAKREKVSDVLATWDARDCNPPGYMRYGDRFFGFPLHAGRFGDSWHEAYDDNGGKLTYAYALAGKVGRSTAKGSLQVTVTGTDAAGATTMTCDTGSVTWNAATG